MTEVWVLQTSPKGVVLSVSQFVSFRMDIPPIYSTKYECNCVGRWRGRLGTNAEMMPNFPTREDGQIRIFIEPVTIWTECGKETFSLDAIRL